MTPRQLEEEFYVSEIEDFSTILGYISKIEERERKRAESKR